MKNLKSIRFQNGATLLIALSLLILMTLLVISGLRLSDSSLLIVGNMQAKQAVESETEQQVDQDKSSIYASIETNFNVATKDYDLDPIGAFAKETKLASECTKVRSVSRPEARKMEASALESLAKAAKDRDAIVDETSPEKIAAIKSYEIARYSLKVIRETCVPGQCFEITKLISKDKTDSVTQAKATTQEVIVTLVDEVSCQLVCGVGCSR